jgi:hypothetical protein
MADEGFGSRGRSRTPAWFEQAGAHGFAAVGAVIGLGLALWIVLFLAPAPRPVAAVGTAPAPLSAGPGPVPPALETTAEPSVDSSPVPAAPSSLDASQTAAATTGVIPDAEETSDETTVAAPDSEITVSPSRAAAPTPPSMSYSTMTPAATGRTDSGVEANTCGYPTSSGPCGNRVSGGGYCYLHRTPVNSTPSYSGGGTVHVRGYYRKDGTYVRPHTRRSPRR